MICRRRADGKARARTGAPAHEPASTRARSRTALGAARGEAYACRAMRRRRRSELFPPDRGLQLRMLVAMVVTPVAALGGIASVVLLGSLRTTLGMLLAVGVGLCAINRDPGPEPDPTLAEEWPDLHAVVERLCVLADLPKPRIVVQLDDRPNSWTISPAHGPKRVYLTTGLLLLLPPDELEAVIAHELSHLAHHDATVLTVVGGVSSLLTEGAHRALKRNWWFLLIGLCSAYALGWVSRLGALFLSREREFAADAGSAALTRHPAALASALRRVTGQIERMPRRDMRVAAAHDMLGLLPVGRPTQLPRLTATHPDVAKRIARLEKLEREMHRARR
jgi:heat shock protein HtpX